MNSLDLKYYFSIFWRRMPWFLVVASIITGIGLAIAMLLPPTYRSQALILVESQQISDDLINATVDVNAIEVIQVIERRLTTRSNLLDIANRFEVFTGEDLSASQTVERMRAATEFTQISSGTERRPGANAFSISFTSGSPQLSADIANEFVTLILEENARLRTDRAGETAEFFRQQVRDLGQELTRLEGEILSFKNTNENALPDSLEYRRNQLGLVQERLLGLEREETALREQITLLRTTLENPDLASLTSQTPATPLEREIAQLERALVQQSAVFSDSNPNIIALRARIDALRATLPSVAPGLPAADPDENPVVTQVRLQIDQAEGRLLSIEQQVAALEDEAANLTETIQATPANEMQLNVLDRNYSNLTQQYALARRKLSEANQGEQLELRGRGERFSIIEQASPPESPESPNRPIIAAGAAGVGMALGLGLIVLLEFLNPAVRRPVEITRKLNIPVFETIPLIRTTGERRKRAAVWAVLGMIVVLSMLGLIYAVHTYYLPLDLILQKILSVTGLSDVLGLIG
ncbi:MAG: Wzz/FepE/Etk N-terminal domain-containing protein [Pseudomonadota bacterium]